MRVDLFTTIHKAIRGALFELAREAARCDLRSAEEIDGLVARVERTIGYLEEHAHHEDGHVLPAVRTVAPELAASLAQDHRALDVVALEVERAAHALAAASPADRPDAGGQLARLVNHLVAVQLVHMNREETEVNEALWGALGDPELAGIHGRILAAIPADRMSEWQGLMGPALSPVERAAVIG